MNNNSSAPLQPLYTITKSPTPEMRLAYAKTLTGQQAYAIYLNWLRKKNNHNKTYSYQTFIDSRFFTSAYRFTELAKKVKLNIDVFIDIVMKEYPNISPIEFLEKDKYRSHCYTIRNQLYSLYVREYHRYSSIDNEIERSMKFIFDRLNFTSISDFFEQLSYNEGKHLLFMKQLSPYFLVMSEAGVEWLAKLEPYELELLSADIDINEMANQLDKNKKLVEELKEVLQSL